jgi:hypothetical protein
MGYISLTHVNKVFRQEATQGCFWPSKSFQSLFSHATTAPPKPQAPRRVPGQHSYHLRSAGSIRLHHEVLALLIVLSSYAQVQMCGNYIFIVLYFYSISLVCDLINRT